VASVAAVTRLARGSATGTDVGSAAAVDDGSGSEVTGGPTTADGEGRDAELEQPLTTIEAIRTDAAARIIGGGIVVLRS